MNIIDTSLWIEFFAGTPLDESIVNVISNSDEMYVPYKLPMADSIIYATAVLWDTELYTQDKHFEIWIVSTIFQNSPRSPLTTSLFSASIKPAWKSTLRYRT